LTRGQIVNKPANLAGCGVFFICDEGLGAVFLLLLSSALCDFGEPIARN
jgi:hypothetical protein